MSLLPQPGLVLFLKIKTMKFRNKPGLRLAVYAIILTYLVACFAHPHCQFIAPKFDKPKNYFLGPIL